MILVITYQSLQYVSNVKNVKCKKLKIKVNHVIIINEDILASFRRELNFQSWDDVLNTNDVNHAYDTFLNIFIHLFNKTVVKKRCINKKPWFTNGLERACAKKKRLYKAFIISKFSEAD